MTSTKSAVPTEQDKLVAQALTKESDRGCAILGAALLSDALEQLLRSVCRQSAEDTKAVVDPLFQGYAPLATFSARIQLSYALGILPRNLRDKIEIIRRMRNDFAHEWGPIDFADPRCVSRLDLLLKRTEDDALEQDDQSLGVLGPKKEQLVTRIALALCISRMLGGIDRIRNYAQQGHDVRGLVLLMEKEELWAGPT